VNTSQMKVLLLVWIAFPEDIKNKKNKVIVSTAVLEDILIHLEQMAVVLGVIRVNTNFTKVLHLV
jgi:hypothetical protein